MLPRETVESFSGHLLPCSERFQRVRESHPEANPACTKPLPAVEPVNEELTRGPRGFHRIALTFDADSEGDALPALVDVLRSARIDARFFAIGHWVKRYLASGFDSRAARERFRFLSRSALTLKAAFIRR